MDDRRGAAPPADRHAEPSLLIADVAGLTGVEPSQLRSWEAAGLLRPRRLPNGTRLYGPEDVARVRLVARSLVNPGRRGSLRRLGAALARGELRPIPEDYAWLAPAAAALGGARFWRSVVESLPALVVACDLEGRATAINPALRAALDLPEPPAGSEALPPALGALPLRWAAATGTRHPGVPLALPGPDGAPQPTMWDVAPLRDEGGVVYGAVAVGRPAPAEPGGQEEWLATAAHDLRGPATVILGRLELAQHAAARAGADGGEASAGLARHLAAAKVATLDLIRSMGTLLDAAAAAAGALIAAAGAGRGGAGGPGPRGGGPRAGAHQPAHHRAGGAPGGPAGGRRPGAPAPGARQPAGQRDQVRPGRRRGRGDPGGGGRPARRRAASRPGRGRRRPETRRAGRWCGCATAGSAWRRRRCRASSSASGARRGRRGGLPGSGLGLYTCRAIAAAHGGHIWVEESVEQDGHAAQGWHGTQIALLLPLAGPAGPAAAQEGGAEEALGGDAGRER